MRLVNRLRNGPAPLGDPNLNDEAADEIERLTGEFAEERRISAATADALIKAEAEMEALRSIGGRFANVAYNLAQHGGEMLSAHDAALLDSLRREWDAARKVTP